jgi:hypothetical protein
MIIVWIEVLPRLSPTHSNRRNYES